MNASKQIATFIVFIASALTVCGLATNAVGDQLKREGTPQILQFDVTSTYQFDRNPIPGSRFHIAVRGALFVPENTRVMTKYRPSYSNTWYTTQTYGPYPKGQTVTYFRSLDLDAKKWNGKTLTVTLIASSTAGAATRSDSVSLVAR